MKKKAGVLAGAVLFCLSVSGPLEAQTFVLSDGTVVEGKVTKGTNNSVMIVDDMGMILPLSLGSIKEVRLPAGKGGEPIAGKLVGWDNGVYELRTQKYLMRVADGRILSVTDTGIGFGGPIGEETVEAPAVTDEPSVPLQAIEPDEADPSPVSEPLQHATM